MSQPETDVVDSGGNAGIDSDVGSSPNDVKTTDPIHSLPFHLDPTGDHSEELAPDTFFDERLDSTDSASVLEQGHVCDYCGKSFEDEDALSNHMAECRWEPQISETCPFCSFSTEFIDDLESHIALKHKDPSSNDSSQTPTKTNKKNRRRKDREQPTVRPICPQCGKSYAHKDSLMKHLKLCGDIDEKVICYLCPFKSKYKSSLVKHICQKHPIGGVVGYEVCPMCKKYYKGKLNLKTHMRTCGKSIVEQCFKCSLCSFKTKWKGSLNDHLSRRHPAQEIERQICPGCKKWYTDMKCLKGHMKSCEEANKQVTKFRCWLCPFETKYKKSLDGHNRHKHPTVEIDRPLCHRCGKFYSDKRALKEHLKSVHYFEETNGETRKLKCFLCDYETKLERFLVDHLKRRHSANQEDIYHIYRFTFHKNVLRDGAVVTAPPGPSLQEPKIENLVEPKVEMVEDNIDDSLPNAFETTDTFCGLPPQQDWLGERAQGFGDDGDAFGKVADDEVDIKPDLASLMDQGVPQMDGSLHSTQVLVCSRCGKSCKTKKGFRVHMKYCGKTNDEIVIFKCFLCLFETKWKRNLKEHILQKHPIDAIDYLLCPLCQKYYKGKYNLRKHMKYCGKTNSKDKFKCPLCPYEAKWKRDLTRHLRAKHPSQEEIELNERPVCLGCGKSFSDKKSLMSHMRKVHSSSEGSSEIMKFHCFLCSYKTSRMAHLVSHLRQNHPLDTTGRPICEECGKSFLHMKSYSNHMRKKHSSPKTNTAIVKMQCFTCAYMTKWKGNLVSHIRRKHPIDATDRLACKKCGKLYNCSSSLWDHLKYCGKMESEIVKFQCFLCSWVTKRKSSLSRHIASKHPIEEIVRPVCTECGRSFADKYCLRKHLKHCGKTSDEIVTFQCFFCPCKTKWKNCLRRHICEKHPIGETVSPFPRVRNRTKPLGL